MFLLVLYHGICVMGGWHAGDGNHVVSLITAERIFDVLMLRL